MQRSHCTGMTLIELMVVVVIVAILAGIAYPSYRQYAIRANRTEAKTALLQATQALEKCYTNAFTYTGCVVAQGNSPSGNYNVALVIAPDGRTYDITATPQAGQVEDTRCGILSIDEAGARRATGSGTVQDCW